MTLLNVDYKIISRALALRLKPKLQKLIHEDQTGFLQGRNISHTIRTVIDVIQIAQKDKLELIMVSMDWEKCFDRISHKALDAAMNYFNFGPKFRDFVLTMFHGANGRVLNNGFLSEPFPILSGCQQGSNLSPLLYVLLTEVLSINIRKNDKIKGIKVGDREIKLAQFTDDMNSFLKFKKQTIMEFESELIDFEEASGLKVNYDKTNVYRLGSLRDSQALLYTRKPFKWTDDPIKILGIVIHHDHMNTAKINYDMLLEKVENNCNLWKHRGLTLMGRVLIINSLCASLYVYKASVLGKITAEHTKKFYKILKNFLWKGGKSKLSLSKLQNTREYGGLGLIDLWAKDVALKTNWVAVSKEFPKIKDLAAQFLPEIRQDIWLCNLKPQDVSEVVAPCFWRDVLIAWANTQWHDPKDNVTKIAMQVLWYNSHIKINKRTLYYKKAHGGGIKLLYNIWNSVSKKFLTYQQLINIYGDNIMTYLEYHALVSAIPGEWIRELKNTNHIMEDFLFPYETFEGKTTKITYSNLIAKKQSIVHINNKWNEKLDVHITWEQLSRSFVEIGQLVKDTKMQNFQYRFLHRIIFCAKILHTWGIVQSPRCTFCEDHYETMDHLFYDCPVVRRFWELFQSWYESVTDTEITLTKNIVFFCESESNLLNTLLIIAKQHIFSRKILERPPNVYILKDKIMECVRIERFYAIRNKKYKPFAKKWKDLF